MQITEKFEGKIKVFEFNNGGIKKRFARFEFISGYIWYEYDYFTESYCSTANETYLETPPFTEINLESLYRKSKEVK